MKYVEFRAKLKEIIDSKGISMKECSYGIGRGKNYISAVIRGEQSMNVEDLLEFCDSVGIREKDLFDDEVKAPAAYSEYLLEGKALNATQLKYITEIVKMISKNK